MGVIPEALSSYARALALDPLCRNAGQNLLLGLNYVYGGEDAEVCRAHADWGSSFAAQFPPLPRLRRSERR